MQVKQLLADVMRMVGRPDAAEEWQSTAQLSGEAGRMQQAMLLCLNAVTDELARGYFPLRTSQKLLASDGGYAFSAFDHAPCRVLSVTCGGREQKWSYSPFGVLCDAPEALIEYEYVPEPFELTDEFSYPDAAVGIPLVCCGVAAEYMLIAGDTACAEMWESKYRAEIDRQLSRSASAGRIPPRRWL